MKKLLCALFLGVGFVSFDAVAGNCTAEDVKIAQNYVEALQERFGKGVSNNRMLLRAQYFLLSTQLCNAADSNEKGRICAERAKVLSEMATRAQKDISNVGMIDESFVEPVLQYTVEHRLACGS